MVLSPEHALVREWLESGAITNPDEVKKYQAEAAAKSDLERHRAQQGQDRRAHHGRRRHQPRQRRDHTHLISDYVLASYGNRHIMAVPGHDQRDWEFAEKFGLPIIEVVKGGDVTKEAFIAKDDSAIMVNSGFLNGMSVKAAIPTMTKWLEEKGLGRSKVNYKLRDWVFSASATGASPSPWCTARSAAGSRSTRASCPCCCPTWTAMSPPTTARARSPR